MTMESENRQEILDQEHLRLLSIFHYIRAATIAFIACIPLIHVTIGIGMIIASYHVHAKPNEPPLALIGWLFAGIGLTIVVLGWLFAVLQFLVGRSISRRQHRTFCLVMSGFNCLSIPYGTLAGVMTFMVLERSTVRALFEPAKTSGQTPASSPSASPPPIPG